MLCMPPKVHTVEFGSLASEHQLWLVAPDYQFVIKHFTSGPCNLSMCTTHPSRTGVMTVQLRLQTADMQPVTSEAEPPALYLYVTLLPLCM